MEESRKEFYKKLLLKIRDENLKQFEETEQSITSNVKDSSGDQSTISFHLADMGTDTIEREKSFLIASMESSLLKDIDAALEKIEKDEFGPCEKCDVEIGEKRLEAIPHTRLCLDCKAQNEFDNF